MAVAGAVGMIGRDLLTGAGGTVFGLYCLVWGVLSAKVLVGLARSRA
jgi:tetrahydromethanopterin S-methyltransferase subunit F